MIGIDHPGRLGPTRLEPEALTGRAGHVQSPRPESSYIEGWLSVARDNTTEDLIEGALLEQARERLKAAMKLLGNRSEEAVLDETIVGAGILAHDAGDLLESLFELRMRIEKAEKVNDG